MSARENVPSRVHVPVAQCSACGALPLSYFKSFQPFRAAAAAARRTGLGRKRFAHLHAGNISVARKLLDRGALIVQPHPTQENRAVDALETAARLANFEHLQLLIDAGADVNYKQNNGNDALLTLLAEAPVDERRVLACVELLLAANANVNARGCLPTTGDFQTGYTSLMMSALHGLPAVGAKLLKAGADLNALNDDGLTSIDLAKQENHDHWVSHMISAQLSWREHKEMWIAATENRATLAPSRKHPRV